MSQEVANATVTSPEETATNQPLLQRVRVTYARQDALRYISHLEMQTVWERSLRRANVPLAYTQGFNPRPRLHLASALPLGFLSRCEIIDFWMRLPQGVNPMEDTVLARDIQAATPPGLAIAKVETVPLNLPPLQTQVIAAEYEATPYDAHDAETLRSTVAALLEQPTIPRERRGKPYDLRLLIERLEVAPEAPARMRMRLTAREGATGRPEEVLDALGLDAAAFRVERTALILAGG